MGWGAGVGSMTLGIQSPLIADSDGVGIVILTMGSHHGFGAALMNGSIALHVVVVADVFPATVVLMVVAALRCSVTGVTPRRTAMQND